MSKIKKILDFEEQLSFIRNFEAKLLPQQTAEPITKSKCKIIMLRYLYNRICSAHKSFLIAGHIFETCAVISDIKDNKEEIQIQKANEHAAFSIIGRLLVFLEYDSTNRTEPDIRFAESFFMPPELDLYPFLRFLRHGKNYFSCKK